MEKFGFGRLLLLRERDELKKVGRVTAPEAPDGTH